MLCTNDAFLGQTGSERHPEAFTQPQPGYRYSRAFTANTIWPMLTDHMSKVTCRQKDCHRQKDTSNGTYRSDSVILLLQGIHPHVDADSKRFPFNNFKHCFNPLFKVLFIFRSRYLFAIGLAAIFSFTRSLPRTLGWIPKQPDSVSTWLVRYVKAGYVRGCHPLGRLIPEDLHQRSSRDMHSRGYNSWRPVQ